MTPKKDLKKILLFTFLHNNLMFNSSNNSPSKTYFPANPQQNLCEISFGQENNSKKPVTPPPKYTLEEIIARILLEQKQLTQQLSKDKAFFYNTSVVGRNKIPSSNGQQLNVLKNLEDKKTPKKEKITNCNDITTNILHTTKEEVHLPPQDKKLSDPTLKNLFHHTENIENGIKNIKRWLHIWDLLDEISAQSRRKQQEIQKSINAIKQEGQKIYPLPLSPGSYVQLLPPPSIQKSQLLHLPLAKNLPTPEKNTDLLSFASSLNKMSNNLENFKKEMGKSIKRPQDTNINLSKQHLSPLMKNCPYPPISNYKIPIPKDINNPPTHNSPGNTSQETTSTTSTPLKNTRH